MKLLGYQVADKNGVNIQGDDNDPSGYLSFEVMTTKTATVFCSNHPGYLLMPIYDDQIEEFCLV